VGCFVSAGLYCRKFKEEASEVSTVSGYPNLVLETLICFVSGAHPASYPMGKRGSFSGGKAAGA
jgi:hypothetical protein